MVLEDVRVLVADADNNLSARLSGYLKESGFSPKVVSDGYLLQKALLEWRPHFLFIDLLFPGHYAQQALQFLGDRGLLGEQGIQVIVMSKHTAELNVRNCLEAGAADFIVKPFQLIDILQRLALLSRSKRYNFSGIIDNNDKQAKNYFHMMSLLIEATNQDKDVHTLRFELTRMISMALNAVRTSIIQTNQEKTQIQVIRSSDDENLNALKLDLVKYPELQYVLRTEKPLFVESLEKDQRLSFVKDKVKSIAFDSMMVLPLKNGSQLQGCLSIRMPKDCKKLSFFDIKLAEVSAQLIAMTWKFPNQNSVKKAS